MRKWSGVTQYFVEALSYEDGQQEQPEEEQELCCFSYNIDCVTPVNFHMLEGRLERHRFKYHRDHFHPRWQSKG